MKRLCHDKGNREFDGRGIPLLKIDLFLSCSITVISKILDIMGLSQIEEFK